MPAVHAWWKGSVEKVRFKPGVEDYFLSTFGTGVDWYDNYK